MRIFRASTHGKRRFSGLYAAFLVLFSLLAAVGLNVQSAQPASAATGSNFNPGLIISDANFFNGNAMSTADVQNFLNARTCWINNGNPRYAAGAYIPEFNTYVASACMKSYKTSTTSLRGDSLCNSYAGSSSETAAAIIFKVGQACGISQKVLLVLLEKEQSLVSDPWPSTRQYSVATGFNCPDTAPCSAASKGFFRQVYAAARQFKNYAANPEYTGWNYFAGRTNQILYHPNRACGTRSVFIQNQATRALYIYTPYTPNSAALTNLYGLGDGCSAYGNRNFWRMYSDWFGNPVFSLNSNFKTLATSLKATTNDLTSNATKIGSGLKQEITQGSMYWHPTFGAVFVKGGIRDFFNALKGAGGILGFPKSAQTTVTGGITQEFDKGRIFYFSSTKKYVVRGEIAARFNSAGQIPTVGLPLADQQAVGAGVTQRFANGLITFKSGVGSAFITGAILKFVDSNGGIAKLGYASSSATATAGATLQKFEQMDVYLIAASNTIVTVSPIVRTQQNSAGGIAVTGLPLAAQRLLADGTIAQDFANGTIFVKSGSGAFVKPGAIKDYLETNGLKDFGGQVGAQISAPLGQVLQSKINAAATTPAQGLIQAFTNATLFWNQSTGYVQVRGSVRAKQNAVGGYGKTGVPLSPETKMTDGTIKQEFENGTVYVKAADTAYLLPGKIRDYLNQNGLSNLGTQEGAQIEVPVSATNATPGTVQPFKNRALYWKEATGYLTVTGGIRAYQISIGSYAKTGFPLENQRQIATSTWVQRFEKGTITLKNGVASFK